MTGYESHRRGWRGNPRLLQETQLKLWVNKIGEARKKKDKEVLDSKLALSPTRSNRSQLQLCGSTMNGSHSEEGHLCSQRSVCHGLSALEIQVKFMSMLRTCLHVYFLCESIHIREKRNIYLTKTLASHDFFPSIKELESLPYHRNGFPIK